MPHIALQSRTPENEHGDSANRNSQRGGVHGGYRDIPALVTSSSPLG